MRKQLLGLGISLLALVWVAGCSGPMHADFGAQMKLSDAEPMSVDSLLENAPDLDGDYVRVTGEVVDVCVKKGCWLKMAGADEQEVFVKFTCPIEGHLIPMEAVGHSVVVEGTVAVETVSEDEARHLAEDAGKTAEEIAEIKGDRVQVRLRSPAARVLGIAPAS